MDKSKNSTPKRSLCGTCRNRFDCRLHGCEVEFSKSDRVADDWCVISDIPSSVIKAYDMATKERIMQSLNTYIEMFGLPYDNIKEDTKKMLVNWMDDTLNGRWTSLADMAEKERDSMNNYEKIEITFKSGETISYGKDEWDDYAYDGKAVIVKKNSAWIGIYNFDDVFCVELKEK